MSGPVDGWTSLNPKVSLNSQGNFVGLMYNTGI